MNEKLKELISIPVDEVSDEDDELLIEEFKKAQLIMPIEITSVTNDMEFRPLKLSDDDGNIYLPLFSDEEELIKGNIECSVVNIYTENLAEIVSDEYDGIVINPFSKYQLKVPLNEFIEIFK